MIIRVEPKDWSMYTVLMYFDTQSPDGEDDAINKYLADRSLEPKRTTRTRLEDREFDIMSFGGCYLGPRHMNALAEIQRSVVEKELLAERIPALLKDGPDLSARTIASEMNENDFKHVANALVENYQEPSSFGQDEQGYMQVTLDALAVQQRFLEYVSANQND